MPIRRLLLCFLLLTLSQLSYAAGSLDTLNKSCSDAIKANNLNQANQDCLAAGVEADKQTGKSDAKPRLLAYDNWADVLAAQAKWADAERVYVIAYNMRKLLLGNKSHELIPTLDKIANARLNQRKFNETLSAYQESLDLRQIKYGKDSKEVADGYHLLGIWAINAGQANDAENAFLQAYNIRRKLFGNQHVLVGKTLQNLAVATQLNRGDVAAEPLFKTALATLEGSSGRQSPDLIDTLESLARLYKAQPNQAEALWRRALEIREKTFGLEHLSVAIDLNEIGTILLGNQAYDQAESVLRRALDIRIKALGINDLQVAESSNNLAIALYYQGKRDDALLMIKHSVAVTQVALGGDNSLTRARWDNLQQILLAQTPAQNQPAPPVQASPTPVTKKQSNKKR